MRKPAYFLVSEAARFFRVSEEHIRRLIRGGEIKAIRLGASIRIPAEEIERISKAA